MIGMSSPRPSRGRADLIVTVNLKDFPAETLDRWGIEAQHPDAFLTHQFHLSQPAFLQAVRTVRLLSGRLSSRSHESSPAAGNDAVRA
jgi:hypothetical protein